MPIDRLRFFLLGDSRLCTFIMTGSISFPTTFLLRGEKTLEWYGIRTQVSKHHKATLYAWHQFIVERYLHHAYNCLELYEAPSNQTNEWKSFKSQPYRLTSRTLAAAACRNPRQASSSRRRWRFRQPTTSSRRRQSAVWCRRHQRNLPAWNKVSQNSAKSSYKAA